MPNATLTHATSAPSSNPIPTSANRPPPPPPMPEGMLEQVWAELKTYHAGMILFRDMEPDQVLLAISGYSARCSEIRAHMARSRDRAAGSFRINVVEPLLADLEFQFKIHSRVQAIREMDFRVSGGQT